MANTYSPTSFTSKMMGEYLVTKNPIVATAFNGAVPEFKDNSVYAPGETVNIRIPTYPTVQRGLAVTGQDLETKVIPYTIDEDDIFSVARNVSLYDEHFNIARGRKALTTAGKSSLNENYIVPAYVSLSTEIETVLAGKMLTTAYLTPDDDPDKLGKIDAFADVSKGRQFMNDLKYQRTMRYGMLNSHDSNALSNSLQNSFQPVLNSKITQNALINGQKSRIAGFDLFESSDISVHIAGEQYATSPTFTVKTVVAEGATTIVLTGVGAVGTRLFKAGDRIAIPSIKILDQTNKVVRDWNLVVTVAADANGDGTGDCTITISEPLSAAGETANVSGLPAAAAPCKMYPSRRVNYFYVPSGVIITPLPLGDIEGANNSEVSLSAGSFPVKSVIQGSASAFTNLYRTSFLMGTKVLAPYIIERMSRYEG